MDISLSPRAQVSVVVIGYDDAAHVAEAVHSALDQGPVVREVIAVDDCSADGSARVLERLAEQDPDGRVRVIRRKANSGGCGTPRNDGLDACTAPYVMFLDSDDILPKGAAMALLSAARLHEAEVAAGLCVRRELPTGRETPWRAELYTRARLVTHPEKRPRLVRDTLCVNKLYSVDFLRTRGIRFPDGPVVYEDFVFTARVLASDPRVALVPRRVYVWQVRRDARRLSISLDRADIDNWRARIAAHGEMTDILLAAGHKKLARASRTAFLDTSLRMYVRELDRHSPEYRTEWWALTRAYLRSFDTADLDAAPAPGRIVARVVLAADAPCDLPRLRELAARPARLMPPYALLDEPGQPHPVALVRGVPVWSADLPAVRLDDLLVRPMKVLPVAVEAELRPRARGCLLTLRMHELYGRVAAAGPAAVDVEFTDRAGSREGQCATVVVRAEPGRGSWLAEAPVDLAALGSGTWDLRLRLRFGDGTSRETTAHASSRPGLLRRTAVPDRRHGLLLVHPYATHSGALAVRLAPGLRGAARVLRGRIVRLLR